MDMNDAASTRTRTQARFHITNKRLPRIVQFFIHFNSTANTKNGLPWLQIKTVCYENIMTAWMEIYAHYRSRMFESKGF